MSDTEGIPNSRDSTVCRGWYSRGYLPHFDETGVVQHITYHLGDSILQCYHEELQRKLDALPQDQKDLERRKHLQQLLDNGYGSCLLRNDHYAKIVDDAFLFGDQTRYKLLAWVVMPNHIHVLIQQLKGWPLAKVVQSWKRHTSRQIHLLQQRSCSLGDRSCTPISSSFLGQRSCTTSSSSSTSALWQIDYWDRFIRDASHYNIAINYIISNPVKAGLIDKPENWRWSSAWSGWENAGYGKRALNMPVYNANRSVDTYRGVSNGSGCFSVKEEMLEYESVM
ncbi:MAG TPA: transposase [Chitinispirillaceae bacterium]|nr:transposase [Chitinispirillaceae bacterium]